MLPVYDNLIRVASNIHIIMRCLGSVTALFAYYCMRAQGPCDAIERPEAASSSSRSTLNSGNREKAFIGESSRSYNLE